MEARPAVDLVWSMSLTEGGRRLRIDYALHNHTGERIYPCDGLLVSTPHGYEQARDAVVVMNGDAPGLVRFVRGIVPIDAPVAAMLYPIARALEPGQKADGHATLPLPLQAWHNYGYVKPLRGTLTSAVLEIAYALGPGEWGAWPLADGSKVTVTQPSMRLKVATTAPKALPR